MVRKVLTVVFTLFWMACSRQCMYFRKRVTFEKRQYAYEELVSNI
jgi:hypothetical protein